jgi:hypothetical protein
VRPFDQHAQGNVARSGKIAEMKLCPRLVDHRLINTNRAEPLRLLLVLGRFPEIASIAMNHSHDMVRIRAIWAEGNRLFSGKQRLIVAALKQPSVTQGVVRQMTVRVAGQIAGGTFHCSFIGRRLVEPTEANLVGQNKAQQEKRRRKAGVDR